VEDVVRSLFFALEKPVKRGIFNVGTGKAKTFLELARTVFSAMNVTEKIRSLSFSSS
jgi:ADP-L-glycero-D-manno-heptose 6-epimerase